jgi:osmotically-inducible protein OsmY
MRSDMRLLSLFLTVLLLATTLMAAAASVSDDAIFDQVRLKLANDRDVGGANITVVVHNGAVELSGSVRKEIVRSKIERLAKKVKGVKSVTNNIKVEMGG